MNILGTWNWKEKTDDPDCSLRFNSLALILGHNVTILENESTTLIYEGTIFDRTPDELMKSQSALDAAYGTYSYVRINKSEREVILGTDRLGFSPLYYSLQGKALCFSTSLSLAKYRIGCATPDYEAWEEILNIGDVIGDKTTIREIRRLDPGTRVHLKDETTSFRTYWNFEIPEQAEAGDYIRRNNELLAEALALTRHSPGPKIVLLSGGEDSRRIAVSAKAISLPITFATQDSLTTAGVDKNSIIAERVSKYLEIALHRQKLPDREIGYNDELIRDYWLGFETNQHDWILPLLRNLPRGALLYDGIAGDITINASIFRPKRYPALLDFCQDKDLDQMTRIIFGMHRAFPIDGTKTASSLFERMREQLRIYPACPRRATYFWLMNHTRRNIGLQAQLYNLMGLKTCFPFLYYPLLMQSISLDPKSQVKLLYQRACMERLNPGIVAIPSTRSTLGKEFLIDFSDHNKRRELLAAKMVALRPEIKRLFPALRLRLGAFEAASILRIRPITSRLSWMAGPLSRMSTYLDWLDDADMPGIPIDAEDPPFLKKRFLS